MKKIRNLVTLDPYYKVHDDGVLEEIVISLRQYPNDGKKSFSFVIERTQYQQTTDGQGFMMLAYDHGGRRRTELTQAPIRKGKTIEAILPAAIEAAKRTAFEMGFSSTPPEWFTRPQTRGVYR